VDSTVGFGQRLAQLLEEREMTQLDLAARVGVTRAAMSRYVSGDREPRFVTLVRIAEELDVHVDELLGSGVGSVDAAVRLVARVRLTDEQKAALRQVLAGET
jgi:transcriptional regulator with XRE-family HTH domain